ncbi:MAG: hypothetical protein LBC63_06350 [Holophagales bacterium]|nr:hypothetical protein [Holophagales bacterium]
MSIDKLHPIESDWFGAMPPGPPLWALAMDSDILALRGMVGSPPICTENDSEGSFLEGLWEADVVELFLFNPRTGFYVEFNLGPRGAWWCCAFDSPRSRCAGGAKRIEGVQTKAICLEEGWDTTMSIPLKSLPERLSFNAGDTLANITFCLGRPQQFVTLADLGGGEPDFHRPDKWIPIHRILKL